MFDFKAIIGALTVAQIKYAGKPEGMSDQEAENFIKQHSTMCQCCCCKNRRPT